MWIWPSFVDGLTGTASPPSPPALATRGGKGDGFGSEFDPERKREREAKAAAALGATRRNENGAVRDEARRPETPPTSPGSPGVRQEPIAVPAPTPPKARKRRTSAAEAYNKGLLLQYLLDSCEDFQCCAPLDTNSEEYYERNWQGHQPLAPPNWDVDPSVADGEPSVGAGTAGGGGVGSAALHGVPSTAFELRMMRRRRRRGVHRTPPRGAGAGGDDRCARCFAPAVEDDVVPFARIDNIKFPGEVADPHLVAKKKWRPDCAHAAKNLPLPSHKRKDAGGCALVPGCDSSCA